MAAWKTLFHRLNGHVDVWRSIFTTLRPWARIFSATRLLDEGRRATGSAAYYNGDHVITKPALGESGVVWSGLVDIEFSADFRPGRSDDHCRGIRIPEDGVKPLRYRARWPFFFLSLVRGGDLDLCESRCSFVVLLLQFTW
jgi:hypothetical protein